MRVYIPVWCCNMIIERNVFTFAWRQENLPICRWMLSTNVRLEQKKRSLVAQAESENDIGEPLGKHSYLR